MCNVFAFPGSYQWCCRSCLYLHLSEMSLAHIIIERSSVGICLLCVGLVLLLWNSQMILLLCCLSISFLRGNLHLLVHCWPQSVTAGGHFGQMCNFPLFFGLLRALSRPISCCFISVLLPVLARVHLLVMFLHCMLQSSVALPLCGGSSWPRYSEHTLLCTADQNHLLGHRHPCCWGLGALAYLYFACWFSWPTLPRWPMRVGRRYRNWSTKPR